MLVTTGRATQPNIYDLQRNYILSTDGSVNGLVFLDIDSKDSNNATISVWRPLYVTTDGVLEFRVSAVAKEQVWIYGIVRLGDCLLIDVQAFRMDIGLPITGTACV